MTFLTRATARVATPAALVAMKLRAMQQRRANVLNKRASDAYDAYRLLAAHDRDGSIARELATAPDGLGAWCVSRARDVFDTNASPDSTMARHRIARHGRGRASTTSEPSAPSSQTSSPISCTTDDLRGGRCYPDPTSRLRVDLPGARFWTPRPTSSDR